MRDQGPNIKPPAKGAAPTQKVAKKITEKYLSNSGAYYLQRYAASTTQFRTIMTRKIDKSCRDHPDQSRADCLAMLDKIITRFTEVGYLNDQTTVRGMVASLAGRGMPQRTIQRRLGLKGFSEEDIRTALDAYYGDNAITAAELDYRAALKLAKKKKLGPFAPAGVEINQNKALGVFARAGFSFEMARKILSLDHDDISLL